MEQIKVLLADDHTIVLEGLKEVLKIDNRIEVVGEVLNGLQVIDFVDRHSVDVVVLDINMPEMDGLTCARKLKAKHKQLKIVILTMYAQKSFIEEILKIGVDGCLLKNNTGKELVDAINRVADGKSYFDLIGPFTSENNEIGQYKFSEREIQIIKLLSQGLTTLEIANQLFISEDTVKTHKKNILRKADVHSTPQLIAFASNNQII